MEPYNDSIPGPIITYRHFGYDGIGSNDLVTFVEIFRHMILCPVCLASSRQTDKQNNLTIFSWLGTTGSGNQLLSRHKSQQDVAR